MNNQFRASLLGASAVLVGFAAHAADLPAYKSAPIQYVRVCDAYGSGFFYIPGTDTCLRVGGYVRVEYSYTPGKSVVSAVTGKVTQLASAQDETGLEVRGRVDLDARTQTEWGTAQTVVWLRGTNVDGIKALSGSSATSNAITAAGGPFYAPGGNASSTLTIERAYIRFAGVTAGVAEENFSAIPSYMWVNYPYPSFPNGVKQLAYTATFGGGFSSTLAIESSGDLYYSNGSSQYDYRNSWETGYTLVGNVRYDSVWGFAQLEGALANDSARNDVVAAAAPNSVTLGGSSGLYSPLSSASDHGAFAIGGTVSVKLPMIAAGDQLSVQAAYAHGLLGLVGCTSASDCSDASERRMVGGVLRQDANLIPTSINGAGTVDFGTTDAWAITGIFTHYFTPQWRTNIAAGYERFVTPTASAAVGTQLGDANLYMAGAALIWSPVKSFDIGVEVDYEHLNQSIQNPAAAFVAQNSPGLSGDNWTGRVRLQRQF